MKTKVWDLSDPSVREAIQNGRDGPHKAFDSFKSQILNPSERQSRIQRFTDKAKSIADNAKSAMSKMADNTKSAF